MYPGLFRRVGATIIDLAVLIAGVYLLLIGPLQSEEFWLKCAAALILAFAYEPVFTALGCTLGQALFGTRVRDHVSLQRISLKQSLLRFFTKYVANIFGGASAGGWHRVYPRQDQRAIHDITADTVVVNAGRAPQSAV